MYAVPVRRFYSFSVALARCVYCTVKRRVRGIKSSRVPNPPPRPLRPLDALPRPIASFSRDFYVWSNIVENPLIEPLFCRLMLVHRAIEYRIFSLSLFSFSPSCATVSLFLALYSTWFAFIRNLSLSFCLTPVRTWICVRCTPFRIATYNLLCRYLYHLQIFTKKSNWNFRPFFFLFEHPSKNYK